MFCYTIWLYMDMYAFNLYRQDSFVSSTSTQTRPWAYSVSHAAKNGHMFTCPPFCVVRFRTVYFLRCADKLCVFSCETFAFICCGSRLFDKRERFANSEHSVSFHSIYIDIMVQSFTIDYAPPSGQSILHCCSFAQLMHDVVCSCVRICNKLHPHILPSTCTGTMWATRSFVRCCCCCYCCWWRCWWRHTMITRSASNRNRML